MSNIDELTERAEKARGKKAAFGPDIPLESYTSNAPAHKKILTLKTLPSNYQSQSLGVGIDAKEDERSGSYFQLDTSVVYSKTSAQDVEVLSVTEAFEKYDWLKDYCGKRSRLTLTSTPPRPLLISATATSYGQRRARSLSCPVSYTNLRAHETKAKL